MTVAPSEPVRARAWNAADMERRHDWRLPAPAGVDPELAALQRWARDRGAPTSELTRSSVDTPVLDALGERIARELDHGSGVAWVRGLGPLDEQLLRLVYLKVGLVLGSTLDTYGRLYDVRDSGASYRDKPIPVSQTRESTGMHTDSSGRNLLPGVIGLACVRQAPSGGGSRIVSAHEAHEQVRRRDPRLLQRLYRSFARDIVTPGSDRGPEQVAANRFPVFSFEGRLCLRYMRYWIERGHDRIGEPLPAEDREAFDALDAALADPASVLSFRMAAGDLLFIDNTTTAHDRDAYTDDPAAPRLLLRLWLDCRFPASKAREVPHVPNPA